MIGVHVHHTIDHVDLDIDEAMIFAKAMVELQERIVGDCQ
jgi:hypothetical protein